jgi:hypothetical protein
MLYARTFIMRTISISVCAMFAVGLPQTAIAQSGKQSRECTIEDVAIYENRIVIQCAAKGGKVSSVKYYAVAVESRVAPMVLQLGLASLRRKVKVYFIDDPSLNPPGCEATICRRLEAIVAIER